MMEKLHELIGQWAAALAQVLGTMANQSPQTSHQPAPAPAAEAEQVWWKQPLQPGANLALWVAAPAATWEHIGAVTLKAAGLDTVEPVEAKNTYLEVLSQSLAGLARAIGVVVGCEVTCGAGEEETPDAIPAPGFSLSLDFGDSLVTPLWIGFNPALIAFLAAPQESQPADEAVAAVPAGPRPDTSRAAAPPTMDLLLDVELPVSISFGKTELPMKDVLKLTTGSIVELNRGVNDPVEVLVNHCLIARGEVVVVEGNYGVRIQQIASRQDRLRSLR